MLHDESPRFRSDVKSIAGYASWGSNDGGGAGPPYYGRIRGSLYPGSFAPRAVACDIVSTNARLFTHPPEYSISWRQPPSRRPRPSSTLVGLESNRSRASEARYPIPEPIR